MIKRPYSCWLLEREPVGEVIRLQEGVSTVGRSTQSTVRIESSYVSRSHAEIIISNDTILIQDLNSINGIYINDTLFRQERVQLHAGDRVGVGVRVTNDDDVNVILPIYDLKYVPLSNAKEVSMPLINSTTDMILNNSPSTSNENHNDNCIVDSIKNQMAKPGSIIHALDYCSEAPKATTMKDGTTDTKRERETGNACSSPQFNTSVDADVIILSSDDDDSIQFFLIPETAKDREKSPSLFDGSNDSTESKNDKRNSSSCDIAIKEDKVDFAAKLPIAENDDCDDIAFSQYILDDMKTDMLVNDCNDIIDQLLDEGQQIVVKAEPTEITPYNRVHKEGEYKIANPVPWIISDDESYDEELEAKVSGWSTRLLSQSFSQAVNLSQVYEQNTLGNDIKSEDDQQDTHDVDKQRDEFLGLANSDSDADNRELYNRDETNIRMADEMFEELWLKVTGCQTTNIIKSNVRTSVEASPVIRNRSKRRHRIVVTSSSSSENEALNNQLNYRISKQAKRQRYKRINEPIESSEDEFDIGPNQKIRNSNIAEEIAVAEKIQNTSTENKNNSTIDTNLVTPITNDSKQSLHRGPPTVIDPPRLPVHRGKLRGVAAVRKEIGIKTQRIREDIRNELFQKELNRKWIEKRSKPFQPLKPKQKAKLSEARKERLRQLADEQHGKPMKSKRAVIDSRLGSLSSPTKTPKIKVTQQNRGAFLTQQTIKLPPKKPFKIPKITEKNDAMYSEKSKPSSKIVKSAKKTQDQITTSFEMDLAKADQRLLKQKETNVDNTICKDSINKRGQRTTNKVTFASMQKYLEETDENEEKLQRLRTARSCLKQPNSILSRQKKSVRFNETPIINYIERVVGTRHVVNIKDILPRSVYAARRLAIRKAYPLQDHTKEIRSQILEWSNEWLKTRNTKIDQALDVTTLPMPPKFETFEQYKRIIFPLMKMEYQTRLERDYKQTSKMNISKVVLEHVDTFADRLILTTKLDTADNGKWANHITYDLTTLDFGAKSNFPKTFAYMSSYRKGAGSSLNRYVFELCASKQLQEFLRRQVKSFYVRPVIDNLRVEFGSFNAVHQLQSSPLFQKILDPRGMLNCISLPKKKIQYKGCDSLNEQQQNILLNTYCKIIDENQPSVTLFQGPPGTGKSRMIVNLALQLLYGDEVRLLDRKILICAQSNGAVDIIAEQFQNICRRMHEHHRFKVIRYGQPDKIHPKVLPISLKKCVELDQIRKLLSYDPNIKTFNKESLQPQVKCLEAEIADLENRDIKNTALEHELIEKRKHLNLMYNIINQRMSPAAEHSVYKWYLKNANIVCTTLSSCVMLSSYVDYFDICIIDEATQSTEPWTLMPLQFGNPALVLVGDTQQLPATVLSLQAANLGLGTSLFTRMQRCLEAIVPPPSNLKHAVALLNIQYRMHPEICQWPNKYFYEAKLSCAPNTLTFRTSLAPFSIIQLSSYLQDWNCNEGQIVNNKEAQFVAKLIKALDSYIESKYYSYGVITPYAQHRNVLNEAIRAVGIMSVTVNTIDSYQGVEKDVIIISNARTTGIGFLGNCQRLNVAMTRAKRCLILCGNFTNIQQVPAWRSLLNDARERNLFHEICTPYDDDIQTKIIEKMKLDNRK